MSTQCPACGHDNLTVTGLSQHLAKSLNPHCKALYNQSRSHIPHANEPEPLQIHHADEEWPGADGGYHEDEEFEWPSEPEKADNCDSDDGKLISILSLSGRLRNLTTATQMTRMV